MKRPIVVSKTEDGVWRAYFASEPSIVGIGITKYIAIKSLKEKTNAKKVSAVGEPPYFL